MALLVDGDINSLDDLREWDNGILDTADGERIDLNAKLRRAQAEVEEEIERFLRAQERGSLNQVVIDRALRHWHALKTLEATYRDAYFNQLNDRYGEKWKHYLKLAEQQQGRYFEAGVAIALRPLRRPAGMEVTFADGALGPATYRLAATAVDALGNESAPSPVQVATKPGPALSGSPCALPAGRGDRLEPVRRLLRGAAGVTKRHAARADASMAGRARGIAQRAATGGRPAC